MQEDRLPRKMIKYRSKGRKSIRRWKMRLESPQASPTAWRRSFNSLRIVLYHLLYSDSRKSLRRLCQCMHNYLSCGYFSVTSSVNNCIDDQRCLFCNFWLISLQTTKVTRNKPRNISMLQSKRRSVKFVDYKICYQLYNVPDVMRDWGGNISLFNSGFSGHETWCIICRLCCFFYRSNGFGTLSRITSLIGV